jgi:HEAT repeat protein
MLEADLQAELADSNPSSLREKLRVLAGIGTLKSTDQIKAITKHADLQVLGTALLTLLFVHDDCQLQETLDFLGLDSHSAQIALLQNTMLQTFTSIKDPIALKPLLANVSSHSGRVRRAVVKALESMKSPESVPYLIGLLDDPEPSIRYDAVVSLADIEQKGPGWTTSIVAYKQEEGAIIPRWKEWWETEGRNKYGGRRASR